MSSIHRRPLAVAGSIAVLTLATAGAPAADVQQVVVGAHPAGTAAATIRRADLVEALAGDPGRIMLAGLEAGGDAPLDLSLERFRVTDGRTRFVVGHDRRPLDYDPDRVVLLRGSIAGAPGSHAVVALADGAGYARIDRAGGSGTVELRGWGPDGAPGGAWTLHVAGDRGAGAVPPAIAPCGVNGAARSPVSGGPTPDPEVTQLIELAVETDYEFAQLFDVDLAAAGDYVVMCYAAVSDIYRRDVNTTVTLSFVRLWDDPDDLFNETDPLNVFRNFWNDNMAEVDRDVAQFFSGRRNFPYGGVAYLSALCGQNGYSVVGYVLGFFDDPVLPGVHQYDIHVAAHELGHNCGALHTHDYGLDNCLDLDGPARRGTIMSYCSQTRSGGNANTDLRFHTLVQGEMREHIFDVGCVPDDCNGNLVDDADDIAGGLSADANGNGIPDECEDCNGNGTLDDADIAGGASDDDNDNGIPDECEPDCNGNGLPDDLDIELGAPDLHGNGIPDECEADCDGDGASDYNEIMDLMPLDIDRDAVLDACQDCDGDGTTDIEALAGSRSCWVAALGLAASGVYQFHPTTGVRMAASAPVVSSPQDLIITPGGRILVTSFDDDRVVEIATDGSFAGDFVPAGLGGLDGPTGLTLSPAGDLYVASRNTSSVLAYDGATGAFIETFVTPGSGTLLEPFGLAFGPNGDLFVTSREGRVLEFDGATGDFVGEFVVEADNAGLVTPRSILWMPDGNLLVAAHSTDRVLEFDGTTGAAIGRFNNGGADGALTMDGPWGLRLGPDGNLYVSRHLAGTPGSGGGGHHGGEGIGGLNDHENLHINSTRIYVFEPEGGLFQRSFVTGHDTGMFFATGFDFMPDFGTDCNANQVPDNCDIAAGTSEDANRDGIPDECQATEGDLDGDGSVGTSDLLLLLAAWGPCRGCPADLDGDGNVGTSDLLSLLALWG